MFYSTIYLLTYSIIMIVSNSTKGNFIIHKMFFLPISTHTLLLLC